MLNEHERQALSELERRVTAADPGFATCLRHGQQRLEGRGIRPRPAATIVPLLVLAVVLLALGSSSGLVVAAFAAALWWLRGYRVTDQEIR